MFYHINRGWTQHSLVCKQHHKGSLVELISTFALLESFHVNSILIVEIKGLFIEDDLHSE